MADIRVITKIKQDIANQGFATIKASGWYFTVGFGQFGRNDLIAPATFPFSVFQTIASKYSRKELLDTGKFSLPEIQIKTDAMGVEPSRYELKEAEVVDSSLLKEQLTSGLMIEDFKRFTIISGPDDDNRLHGENDCRFEKSSKDILLKIIYDLHEKRTSLTLSPKEEQERVDRILNNTPTPRNRRRKSNKKKKR